MMEALATNERWYFVSNAPRHRPLEELVKAASRRHLVEEAFENAKGEVGLDHYEVRCCQGRPRQRPAREGGAASA